MGGIDDHLFFGLQRRGDGLALRLRGGGPNDSRFSTGSSHFGLGFGPRRGDRLFGGFDDVVLVFFRAVQLTDRQIRLIRPGLAYGVPILQRRFTACGDSVRRSDELS